MLSLLADMLPKKRGGAGGDMFSRLCRAQDEEGRAFSDDDVLDHMSFLMMAAHDTTTSTLTSLTYELGRNPDWQDRVREECVAFGDEAPGFDFGYDGEAFFEAEIWPRLAHRMSSFERCGHMRGWAGLYAVTPDCSGIADRVEGFANLYEAHSFTGRGVMQSYAVGVAISELVTTGRYESHDLAPLTRRRFGDRARWVPEALHI